MAENKEPPTPDGAGGPEDDSAKSPDDTNNNEVTGLPEGVQHLPNIDANILSPADDARRQELKEAALKYAGHGWHVIPIRWVTPEGICSCDRGEECPSPAKHPVHVGWPAASSCDPDTVAGWWRPDPGPNVLAREWYPRANVGIVTGRDSGVWVMDVDTYAGGERTLGAYERRNGDLPATFTTQTGRGGQHYYFRYPDGFEIRNSAKKALGAGLDVRGFNGFVVCPPSISLGGPYELNPAHDVQPAEAPEWLLNLLRGYDKQQNGSAISGDAPAATSGAARRYAEGALKAESERMRSATEADHNRNDTLNECAFSLGALGGAGLLTEEAAWNALHEAALSTGLGEGEIRGTFLSGWRKGLENPRVVQWRAMGQEWPVRARTEFGNADRMADHFGDQLRWCPERSTWMTYRNGVWATDVKDVGEWYAQQMIRRLAETEALSFDDHTEIDPKDQSETPSARAMFLEWVGKQESRKAVSSASRLAAGLPLMRMSQSTFDADPIALNVRNGVIDLSAGELLPHAPEQRMTLQCAASFNGLDELAPMWDAFLCRVQPDPDMRAYLQRVAGYCATALTVEQAFFLWQGVTGANGKSVAQAVISRVLGTYSQTIPVETLMASSVDGRVPNDVARMAGKRFLIASESQAGKRLDEQRIKQLTGGDTIAARFMRAEYFEFQPVGKIQLATNHLPRMSDDSATWRRVHLVIWPVEIPKEEQDGLLADKIIKQEAAGVLAWIVRGALAWHQQGLNAPESVHQARVQYQQDEDIVGQFITDCLDVVPPSNAAIGRDTRAIYHTYKAWAIDNGHPIQGQKWLTPRLKKKGYEHVRSNGWNGFPALQVKNYLNGDGGAG